MQRLAVGLEDVIGRAGLTDTFLLDCFPAQLCSRLSVADVCESGRARAGLSGVVLPGAGRAQWLEGERREGKGGGNVQLRR